MLLAGCITAPDLTPGNNAGNGQRIFRACESLRCGDPEIAQHGIAELFNIGGLEAFTLLHLKWIAEPNPEIRRYILKGFTKLGDHRHIADPDFPQGWVEAAKRSSSPERDARLRELEKYFPKEMKSYR